MTACQVRASLAAVLAASTLGCAARRQPAAVAGEVVGAYRARIEIAGEPGRRADLWLWTDEPDRLHLEIAGPVGGPRVIVDGGHGQWAVAFPDERLAFVGPASQAREGTMLGLDAALPELVAAILRGIEPEGELEVEREGPVPGLPTALRLRSAELTLALELREVRPIDQRRIVDLGQGRPPPGFEILPLERLAELDVWGGGARRTSERRSGR